MKFFKFLIFLVNRLCKFFTNHSEKSYNDFMKNN